MRDRLIKKALEIKKEIEALGDAPPTGTALDRLRERARRIERDRLLYGRYLKILEILVFGDTEGEMVRAYLEMRDEP